MAAPSQSVTAGITLSQTVMVVITAMDGPVLSFPETDTGITQQGAFCRENYLKQLWRRKFYPWTSLTKLLYHNKVPHLQKHARTSNIPEEQGLRETLARDQNHRGNMHSTSRGQSKEIDISEPPRIISVLSHQQEGPCKFDSSGKMEIKLHFS